MLGHHHSSSGHHKGRGGGNIKGPRAIAAGSTGINQDAASCQINPGINDGGLVAHHPDRTGNFGHGLTLHPEPGDKGADLGRSCLSTHDLVHHLHHLDLSEVLTGHDTANGLLDIHIAVSWNL